MTKCDGRLENSHATSRQEYLQVVCLITPDGQSLYFEAAMGEDYAKDVLASWRKQNPRFENTECTSGMVTIRMLREDYSNIAATNNFDWPAYRRK